MPVCYANCPAWCLSGGRLLAHVALAVNMCLPLGMGTINQYSTSGLSQSLLARAHDRGLSPSNNRKGPDRLASVSKFSNHAPTGKVSLLKTLIGLLCSGLFEATKTCTFGALMTEKVLGSRNFQSQRHGRLALS